MTAEVAQAEIDHNRASSVPVVGATTEIQPPQYSQPSPEDVALQKQMDMMKKTQARQEIALAQGQGETNITEAQNYKNKTIMNAAELMKGMSTEERNEFLTAPEKPPETTSSPVQKTETSKGPWNWSDLDVIRFIRNLEIKVKFDKVVEVVKNVVQAPFKAFGRFWKAGDAPKTPQVSPPAG